MGAASRASPAAAEQGVSSLGEPAKRIHRVNDAIRCGLSRVTLLRGLHSAHAPVRVALRTPACNFLQPPSLRSVCHYYQGKA